MKRSSQILPTIALLGLLAGFASAAERFPPPEFVETDHKLPPTNNITDLTPRADIYEYIDVAVLLAALGLSSYLVLKKRSRRAVFILMLFSLLYFGFWRKGCVCSIGAIQNVVLAAFDPEYAIPLTVVLFFILPLVFTLFFGRTFCAAVCPFGAVQDLVAVKPVTVPLWLESALRLFAYVYLAAAVLFAATGSAFIICRYDPFVAFFRLAGSLNILLLGLCILLIGVFVGRPYCRFLCPYGVILRQLSRVSRKRVTITPDECIRCRLCEDSCPFGAVRQPTADWPQTHQTKNKKLLALLIIALPLLALAAGWMGANLNIVTSRAHPTVKLAERIYLEETGAAQDTTDASSAFRATGKDVSELYSEATAIRRKFSFAGWLLGAFVGLVVGLKLIALTVKRQRTDYEADRAACLACGRCFQYCPKEQLRMKKAKEAIAKTS